jgi:integrase
LFCDKDGNFNYAEKFPNSPNLARFGQDRKEITVLELTERWSELKRMEISSNTMSRYESIIKNMLPRIGENKMVSAVTTEDLLYEEGVADGLPCNEEGSPDTGKRPEVFHGE